MKMPRVKPLLSALVLVISSIALISCSTMDKNSDTPEGAYGIAQEFEKSERYEEAIRRYQEIKNKFPYSKYAQMAELSIADVYFKQESYAEAQVAYQSFRDLHPKHPQVDYVIYQLALSYFNQLPETIDRDLTLATNAIATFEELIRDYPKSNHSEDAQKKRQQATQMLAEKEQYIADFYFKRAFYGSALSRYEGLLKKFSGMGFEPHAIAYAAVSASRVGDMDKARKFIFDLEKRFPNSAEIEFAKKEIK